MDIPGLDFTVEELRDAVDRGRVTARRHPSLPYTIYNYSPDVQYSHTWDKVTLACRGLILDDNYFIVARPWEKFFNLGMPELPARFVEGPLQVMDKLDGSLGILYPNPNGGYEIATRGSFESEQAVHASQVWSQRYADFAPNADLTMLFEIIYPSNRVVLDYGDMDDLVLLGAVRNSTGYYAGPIEAAARLYSADRESAWTGPVARVFEHTDLSGVLGDMERSNAEGFVIRFHNFLVKVKQPDYLELHKLVTECNPRRVWEQLKGGKKLEQIVAAFPDEFHEWVEQMGIPILEQYAARSHEIADKYLNHRLDMGCVYDDEGAYRKRFARLVRDDPDKRYMFLLLDNRSIGDVLWTELRPKDETV